MPVRTAPWSYRQMAERVACVGRSGGRVEGRSYDEEKDGEKTVEPLRTLRVGIDVGGYRPATWCIPTFYHASIGLAARQGCFAPALISPRQELRCYL